METKPMNQRNFWVNTLLKIVDPVFNSLSQGNLRSEMPAESNGDLAIVGKYMGLEALGRSLAGIGPWLNLNDCPETERESQNRLRTLVCQSLEMATDESSPDFMTFGEGTQPIVDAAFLAQGLLRSWESVWLRLNPKTKADIIKCMRLTRTRKPWFNNWLLFSAMIEAFLYKAGSDWDPMRIDYALRQHEQWYKGDGVYGDGPQFRWDYYNSFVIQPMIFDIVNVGGEITRQWSFINEPIKTRMQRYAAIQERLIGPDGSYPPIGRSLAYRFGAFQTLALVSFQNLLPESLSPSSVRCALSAVIKKVIEQPGTFDEQGWLRIGLCGYQPAIGENYITTGSLYLCLCGMLPLGLPADDSFWADSAQDWTSKRAWSGKDIACDKSIK
jgi:hypothetical protein